MASTAIANARSRQQWAEIINADWRKSIDSIIQTGRDLANAKAELPHGEFIAMIEADLPFSRQTPLFHTVLGDLPNGYGIIAVFPTYEEAWRFIRNDERVLFMGVPYSMDELFSPARVIDPELLAMLEQRRAAA